MLAFLAQLDVYPLTLLRYITFRTSGATGTAYVVVLWFGPAIGYLLLPKGQAIHAGRLQSLYQLKRGGLTINSLIILTGIIVASLLWANPTNHYVWAGVFVAGTLAAIGVYDNRLSLASALVAAAAFGFIAYMAGNAIFANYWQMRYVPGMGELTVVCGALVGAGLASM